MAMTAKAAKRIDVWRNEVNTSTPVCAQQEACPQCEGDAAFHSSPGPPKQPLRLKKAVGQVLKRLQKDGRKGQERRRACADLFTTHALREDVSALSVVEANGGQGLETTASRPDGGSTNMYRSATEARHDVGEDEAGHHSVSSLFGGRSSGSNAKPTLAIDDTAARLARAQKLLLRGPLASDKGFVRD
jgi:hypothetical protein